MLAGATNLNITSLAAFTLTSSQTRLKQSPLHIGPPSLTSCQSAGQSYATLELFLYTGGRKVDLACSW